jgi:hypothetical protein
MENKFDSKLANKISQKNVNKATGYLDLAKNYDKQLKALKTIFSIDELEIILDVTLNNKKKSKWRKSK